MTLLTLNTLSNKTITSREEVNDLLLQLVYGIKDFLSYKEYKGSRFYTEEKDIYNFEIINDYQFKEAMKSLKREILDFFSQFLDKQCDNDCLNKITDKEMENILDSDLYFDDEPFSGQNYIILSYCVEKRTFLLSFGKDKWNEYKVIAKKIKEDGSSEKVILNNIANKEHSKSHYHEKQLENLPANNIFYTQEFKDDYLSANYDVVRSKIVKKIKEAEEINFEIDGFLVKSIDGDIWQIKIGTQGGLQQSAVRVLFKKISSNIYIVHILTKQGGTTYNYETDVAIAQKNYVKLKKELDSEI